MNNNGYAIQDDYGTAKQFDPYAAERADKLASIAMPSPPKPASSGLAGATDSLGGSLTYLAELVGQLESVLDNQGFLKYPTTNGDAVPSVESSLASSPIEQYLRERTSSVHFLQDRMLSLISRASY